MESFLLLLCLVGYSAQQGPEETSDLTLQQLLRQQSEILQRLGDQAQKMGRYQSMMEFLHETMERQQTMLEDIKSTVDLSYSDISQDITKQHSALQLAIQDIIQEQYAGCTNTTESRQDSPSVRAVDCHGHRRSGSIISGVYDIYPVSCSEPISVWCDMDKDGGGWTVFLARQPQPNPENFRRNWEEYKDGFGNSSAEYWIGNELLHTLTGDIPTILRVDVEDFSGIHSTGTWLEFSVGSSRSKYQLTVGQFQPTVSSLGDSLASHNGMAFSTVDAHNDRWHRNCAAVLGGGGGWWFEDCGDSTPTGILKNTNQRETSMVWWGWPSPRGDGWVSLRRVQMKIQPKDYQGPVRMCLE